MASTNSTERVWCQTCRGYVTATVERYLKGTTMARCPICDSILHPKTGKMQP